MRWTTGLVWMALLIAACSPFDDDLAGKTLRVSNHTIVDAIVSVNGVEAGVLGAGVAGNILLAGGGPPYRIDVRSKAGTELGEFQINASDVTGATSGASMGGTSVTDCGIVEFRFGSTTDAPPDPAQAVQADPALCH
jgi:hypothetical protein